MVSSPRPPRPGPAATATGARKPSARCSAHASTATATASLYFLSALYCSALPPRCIFLHICLWPRRQWSCWHVELQYLNLRNARLGRPGRRLPDEYTGIIN